MTGSRHVVLLSVEKGKSGNAVQEEVLVERLREGRLRVLRSPGLLQGLAAGDEIALDPSMQHGFRLLRRGGNVCIQFFREPGVSECRAELTEEIAKIGGRLDGEDTKLLVFTVPVTAGFDSMESIMDGASSKYGGSEWLFGNVYDAESGLPLNWWND